MNPAPPLPGSDAALQSALAPRAKLWRHALFMALLCIGIAVLLAVIDGGGLPTKLIYSFSIGLCCWIIIDGGRHAATALYSRWRRRRGLPALPFTVFVGWRWIAPLMLVGMVAGPMLGTMIADSLTGLHSPGLFRPGSTGSALTLVVTVLGSALAFFAMSTMERLANARALAEAAQRQAAENQLKLLESQLEPHMLFNTLANLRVLITLDPPRAQAMLDQIIAFLRATLNASRVGTHPLAAEFERSADYLALIGVRMGARLQVMLDLPAELRTLPVPPLLLQPLVENSVRHGLEPKVEGGRIEVRARRDGARLVLSVRDTGLGLEGASPASAGTRFGLQQVRERLRTLYGADATLSLETAAGAEGGALATITLPIRP